MGKTRGKTRLDHIRNEDTRKEAPVKPVETSLENKIPCGLATATRTQPLLREVVKTRSFWEKEQRLAEKETE